jgi:hypothetical protein
MVQPFMPKGVIEACNSNAKGGMAPIAGMAQVGAVAGLMVATSVVNPVIGLEIAQKGRIMAIIGKMGNLVVKN